VQVHAQGVRAGHSRPHAQPKLAAIHQQRLAAVALHSKEGLHLQEAGFAGAGFAACCGCR